MTTGLVLGGLGSVRRQDGLIYRKLQYGCTNLRIYYMNVSFGFVIRKYSQMIRAVSCHQLKRNFIQHAMIFMEKMHLKLVSGKYRPFCFNLSVLIFTHCLLLWMDWGPLTHWGRDKMAAVSQTTLSNAFSWMKMLEFRLRFHWSLFLKDQLTIIQHWFR